MDSDEKGSCSTLYLETPYYSASKDELAYMGLIQNQIRPFYPNFASAIAAQSSSEREQGRCALVEFSDAERCRTTTFANSTHLGRALEEPWWPASSKPEAIPKRRLFILEDLPCNHMLALGSRLRVPPSFFAGHYDDPVASTFNHRNPLQRHSRSQMCLRYASSNRVEVDAPKHSDIYAFNTNVNRYLHVYDPKGIVYDEHRSHHNLSFWCSQPREDGSWDAVLLVDPPLRGYVKCLATKELVPLRKGISDEASMPKYFLNPEMDHPQELSPDPAEWANSYSSPQYASMFQDILASFQTGPTQPASYDDPYNVSEVARKLVLSTNLAFLRRRYLNMVTIQRTKLQPHTFRNNYFSSFSEGSFSYWNDGVFNFTVGACSAMRELSREMEENTMTLGLDSPNPSAPQWEIDGWKLIRDLTDLVEETLSAFATGYMQYVTIQEAHVSNGNAQSLSRITVLTMLFIPLSTVASIFSMSGEFLPGETRAWVFWVAAIPVLVLLAYLYWYRQLSRVWKGRRKSLLPLFETRGKKNG